MKKANAAIKKEIKSSETRPFRIFLKNLTMLAGSVILLLLMKTYNNGYGWAYENLLKANLEFMNQAAKMSEDDKLNYKLGFSWKYMNFIKENTPKNSIIRLPPDSAFFPINKKSDFNSSIRSKIWASYFVYPRRLVYESEKDSSALYKQANYQAIVNYWGYDKLSYEIEDKVPYTVLPLKSK